MIQIVRCIYLFYTEIKWFRIYFTQDMASNTLN